MVPPRLVVPQTVCPHWGVHHHQQQHYHTLSSHSPRAVWGFFPGYFKVGSSWCFPFLVVFLGFSYGFHHFPMVFLGFSHGWLYYHIYHHVFSNDSEWSRRSRRANMLGSLDGALSSCGIMNDCMVNHRNSWFMLIYLLKMVIFQFANCKRLPEATVWDIVGYHIYIYWEWEL